jgi:membrane protein
MEDVASSPQASSSGVRLLFKPKLLLAVLKAALVRANNDKVPRMGAALAYYTIFSLAPLLVISISVAGIVFGQEAVRGEITRQIQDLIGSDSAKAIQALIQSANHPAPSAIASVVGVVVLLIGASGVFTEMYDALNTIWGVDPNLHSGIWNFVKARVLSFGMVLAIGFLLMVSLLLSAALAAIAKYAEESLSIPVAFLHSLDFLFSLFFITVLFALIFKLLPNVAIPWTDVWVGAALTSLLFTIGKFLIGFYIGKSVTASTYGAAGSLVIIVAWIYYSAQILYFGAEFTRVYATECGSRCGK